MGTLTKNKRFRYHGILFEDLGLSVSNLSFSQKSKRISQDRELGMSKYEWGKYPYDYEAFYKAANDSQSDLFLCVENGNVYIPGNNELFLWI